MVLSYLFRGPKRLPLFVIITIVALSICASTANAVTPTSKVRFYTNLGPVEIEMYGTQSPLNVANFLSYVDDNSYNNTLIHRTRDQATVVGSELFDQGGSFYANSFSSVTPKAAVVNEFNSTNGLSNVQYTLAAAQTSDGPDSATSGWFINQTNNAAAFDPGKYTIMGKVTKGMSIIDSLPFMQNLPILVGTPLESMPLFVTGSTINEVIINRAVRIPIIVGDYNNSGSVTSADYTTWRTNLGSTTNVAADGNGNGVVDAADYVLWRKIKPPGSGSGAGLGEFAAPEPTSAMLLLFGGIMLGLRRGRVSTR